MKSVTEETLEELTKYEMEDDFAISEFVDCHKELFYEFCRERVLKQIESGWIKLDEVKE